MIGLSKWESRIISEVSDLAFRLAVKTTDGWSNSIFCPRSLLENESVQGVSVAGRVYRATMPDVLIRINFDSLRDTARGDRLRIAFRGFPRPSIEGIGNLIVEDTPEGIVILRRE